MSILNVTQYSDLGAAGLSIGKEPSLSMSNVEYGPAPVQSEPMHDSARFVRLVADEDSYISFGVNPDNESGGLVLPAGRPEFFAIPQGKGFKIMVNQL